MQYCSILNVSLLLNVQIDSSLLATVGGLNVFTVSLLLLLIATINITEKRCIVLTLVTLKLCLQLLLCLWMDVTP